MRTWDTNRQTINQLWPLMEFTAEEKKLWHDDLSGLDQAVLYDAIRNVKRNNDTNYPQLKWVRDEYRVLERLRNLRRPTAAAGKAKQIVNIDADKNARMRDELKVAIELATPADWQSTVDLIADKAGKCDIEMATAIRLVRYLNERLGMADGGRIGDAA